MEFYSNNYSKYIETLKAEKSKKAFQELVKNSQEIKSEVVSFTENYSTKETNNLSSKESLPNKENSTLYSTSKPIGAETFLDADEYSAISTRVEIENGDREKNEVSSVEISDESFENKTIDSKISETEKTGNEVAKVAQNESRSGSEISLENEVSKKEGNNVSLENESAEKAGNAVSEQITDSERSGIDLNREDSIVEKSEVSLNNKISDIQKSGISLSNKNSDPEKNSSNLIYKIIEEKKAKKELIDSVAEGRKDSGSFNDFISGPKKKSPRSLTKSFQYFLIDGKDYEAAQYKINSQSSFKYYPAGDYATIEANAGQSVQDIFNTIANDSNWDATSNKVVSSMKVATSIIDMINLSGPSKNIYTDGVTKNKIRYDLKIDSEELSDSALKKDNNFLVFDYDDGNVISSVPNAARKSESETKDDEEAKVSTPFDSESNTGIFISSTSDKTSRPSKENGVKLKDDNTDVEKIIEPDGDKARTNESIDVDEKFKGQTDDTHGDLVVDTIKQTKEINGTVYKDYDDGAAYEPVTKFAYTNAEDTASDRVFDDTNYLGKIYVIPPFSQLAKTDTNINTDVAFTIPLQNNLQFEQISRAASYNAISFFGRIGDVQQYSKSGSLEAITLTTKYFVDGTSERDYTMAKLQDIEMMYRSLVLPVESQTDYLGEEDKNSKFYYFTRPPLINVVLGKSANSQETTLPTVINSGEYSVESGIYKNLFTDIISTYDEKKGYTHGIFYKNFVVTNVSIDKNDNDYNYYVTEGGKDYLDKMGFAVTLTVLEIDENYLGSTPSFNNYYNTLTHRGSK